MTVFLLAALLLFVGAFWLYLGLSRTRAMDETYLSRLKAVGRVAGIEIPDDRQFVETERLMGLLLLSSSGVTRRLLLAGWTATPERVMMAAGALLVAFLVGVIAFDWIGAFALPALLVGLAWWRLDSTARRHATNFADDLPNFLERFRQLIASGNSVGQAFDKAMFYSNDKVRRYLDPVALRMKFGVPLADALRVQATRLRLPELGMLALITRTNLRYGGNLSQILEHLIRVLRDQSRIRSEFHSLSSELRSSSKVMMAMPIAVGALIFVINPDYMYYFVDTAGGQFALALAAVFLGVGILLMRRMMRLNY